MYIVMIYIRIMICIAFVLIGFISIHLIFFLKNFN